jgi:hypothetical protein
VIELIQHFGQKTALIEGLNDWLNNKIDEQKDCKNVKNSIH